jgi:hypothetical protein
MPVFSSILQTLIPFSAPIIVSDFQVSTHFSLSSVLSFSAGQLDGSGKFESSSLIVLSPALTASDSLDRSRLQPASGSVFDTQTFSNNSELFSTLDLRDRSFSFVPTRWLYSFQSHSLSSVFQSSRQIESSSLIVLSPALADSYSLDRSRLQPASVSVFNTQPFSNTSESSSRSLSSSNAPFLSIAVWLSAWPLVTETLRGFESQIFSPNAQASSVPSLSPSFPRSSIVGRSLPRSSSGHFPHSLMMRESGLFLRSTLFSTTRSWDVEAPSTPVNPEQTFVRLLGSVLSLSLSRAAAGTGTDVGAGAGAGTDAGAGAGAGTDAGAGVRTGVGTGTVFSTLLIVGIILAVGALIGLAGLVIIYARKRAITTGSDIGSTEIPDELELEPEAEKARCSFSTIDCAADADFMNPVTFNDSFGGDGEEMSVRPVDGLE